MILKRNGNTLYPPSQTCKYLICERKPKKGNPATKYLLKKEGKESTYISSLFGSGSVFRLDYRGKYYTLTLTDTEAVLEEVVYV